MLISALVLRQALQSALISVWRDDNACDLNVVCLHQHSDNPEVVYVMSMNGHQFWRQRVSVQFEKDKFWLLPVCQDICADGQLLIKEADAKHIVKMLPKEGQVELAVGIGEKEHTATLAAENWLYKFAAPNRRYPDYMIFLNKAEANKNYVGVPQGFLFPHHVMAAALKSFPDSIANRSVQFFLSTDAEGPCLIEKGRDGEHQLVIMPMKPFGHEVFNVVEYDSQQNMRPDNQPMWLNEFAE